MKITIYGNCQAAIVWKVVTEAFAGAADVEVALVRMHLPIGDQERYDLSNCDLLIAQLSHGDKILKGLRPANCIQFPVIMASFLWPYATESHPRNSPVPGYPGGPYPGQLGNAILNRLIKEGCSK